MNWTLAGGSERPGPAPVPAAASAKGPSKRRIVRKDRRQTLEVLTSDDEVNEFVESRSSTYIEPKERGRLHESRPQRCSSFETLYNPQFDAPDSAVGADYCGSQDSLDSLVLEVPAKPTGTVTNNVPVAEKAAKEQLDHLPDPRQPAQPLSAAAEEPELQVSAAAEPATLCSSALAEMDRLADEILRSREPRPRPGFAHDEVDAGGIGQANRNEPGGRSLPRKTVAFRLPEEDAALARLRARVGAAGEADAPGVEAVTAIEKLRQLVSQGQPKPQTVQQPPPVPNRQQKEQQKQLFPAAAAAAAAAVAAAAEAPPRGPSVAQQLRALLPSAAEPAAAVSVEFARRQLASPSTMSAQAGQTSSSVVSGGNRHAPMRSGSLARSGSYSASGRPPLAVNSHGNGLQWTRRPDNPAPADAASLKVAAPSPGAPVEQQEQPFRRSWSMQQQQNQIQRQERQFQMQPQVQLRLHHNQQKQQTRRDQYKIQQLETQQRHNMQMHNQQQHLRPEEMQQQGEMRLPSYQQQQQIQQRQEQQVQQQQQQQSQPVRRTNSMQLQLVAQQSQQQLSQQHGDQFQRLDQRSVTRIQQKLNNREQHASLGGLQLQSLQLLPPPPIPPRRQPASLQRHQHHQQFSGAFGDFPSIDHVCKRILLTDEEARRHRIVVTSAHYRSAPKAFTASSVNSSGRHRPLRLSSQ